MRYVCASRPLLALRWHWKGVLVTQPPLESGGVAAAAENPIRQAYQHFC